MKVALMLTGLARNVRGGYENTFKSLLNNPNLDIDLYLQCWDSSEAHEVLKFYPKPKYFNIAPPINFKGFTNKIKTVQYLENNYLKDYGVNRYETCFPMFHLIEQTYKHIFYSNVEYDCIIRTRFDLGIHHPIDISKYNLRDINISSTYWNPHTIPEDNLCITNMDNANKLFYDMFFNHINISRQTGYSDFSELNFMKILQSKDLFDKVVKHDELVYDLLR